MYLIKSGRVIDPVNAVDGTLDILIADGRIKDVTKEIARGSAEVIDAKGMIVAPGFIDIHVHLREPGREDEETVLTGTRAAIRGGFTAVACMPNTDPPVDGPEMVRILKGIIKKDALTEVFPVGAITRGRLGKELADIKAMKAAGIIAVSDDGSSVNDAGIMSKALKAAARESLLVICHCEDSELSGRGVMNQGFMSTKMGLRGIPREAEYEIVKRDTGLAAGAGAAVHIAHVSCKESIDLIRKAKRNGVKVTAETAPHYFTLTDENCAGYDTNMKMNPPLRTAEDVEALKKGLGDGTIDAIAGDHAPHTDSEKDVEFDMAPFGIIGLETSLSLSVMGLIAAKILTWPELILRMSSNPARILGIEGGSLEKGAKADVVIIDPDRHYVYSEGSIESKSRNSPFKNRELRAQALYVFVNGRPVMKKGCLSLLSG